MTFAPLAERLDTTRLVLTPEVPDDAPWLAELFTARGAGTVTVEAAVERVATMTRTRQDTGIGVLVLRLRTTGEPLGYCGLVVGRSSVVEPELAYELLPRAHGHGYATEAALALVDAAFATGRTRLWSTTRTWNLPSLRVLEKVGFRRDRVTVDDLGEIVWLVLDAPTPGP